MNYLVYPTVRREHSDLRRHQSGSTGVRVYKMGKTETDLRAGTSKFGVHSSLSCPTLSKGLTRLVNEEYRDHVRISYVLTEDGEAALAAIEAGFVWDADAKAIDHNATDAYWRGTLDHLITVKWDEDYRERLMERIKGFSGTSLSYLVDEAALVLLSDQTLSELQTERI